MKKILGTLVLFLALLLPTAVIQSQTTPASAVSGLQGSAVLPFMRIVRGGPPQIMTTRLR
jgi:hypothetical protein